MKRKLIFLLAFITVSLLFISISIPAFADDVIQSGTWGSISWTLNETTGELVISGEGDIESLRDQNDAAWVPYKNNIKTVTIEDGVTGIGFYAFANCDNLSSVTIPESVTTIRAWSFKECQSLREVVIPNSCVNVSDDVFLWCNNIVSMTMPMNAVGCLPERGVKTIVITNGTSIPGSAFYRRDAESITLPDSVTSIGSYAFYNCGVLKNLNIPKSLTEIGDNAFEWCYSLESVDLPEGLISIGDSAFLGCKKLKNIVIPNSVVTVKASAFRMCEALTSAVLPEGLTAVEDYLFADCNNLESIIIPSNVECIGDYAFNGCKKLEEIIIPDKVIEIKGRAFGDCSLLKKVTIPNGILTLWKSAFEGAKNIETFIMPIAAIHLIPKNSLKTVVFTSGNKIPENAFEGCETLQKVAFCGSEADWQSVQANDAWMKDLDDVVLLYHDCEWSLDEDKHIGSCSVCGSQLEIDHIWNRGTVTTEATHLAKGEKTYKCTLCDEVKTEELEKIAEHNYTKCVEHDNDQHKNICECGETALAKHSYGAWKTVIKATAEKEGERQKVCACGHKISEVIPALKSNKKTDATSQNETADNGKSSDDANVEDGGCSASFTNRFIIIATVLLVSFAFLKKRMRNEYN